MRTMWNTNAKPLTILILAVLMYSMFVATSEVMPTPANAESVSTALAAPSDDARLNILRDELQNYRAEALDWRSNILFAFIALVGILVTVASAVGFFSTREKINSAMRDVEEKRNAVQSLLERAERDYQKVREAREAVQYASEPIKEVIEGSNMNRVQQP